MEECCLLVCSTWFAQPAFKEPSTIFPGGGTALSGLGPPQISHSSRKFPADLPTGHSNRGVFSIEILSSKVTLACVKLTKNVI